MQFNPEDILTRISGLDCGECCARAIERSRATVKGQPPATVKAPRRKRIPNDLRRLTAGMVSVPGLRSGSGEAQRFLLTCPHEAVEPRLWEWSRRADITAVREPHPEPSSDRTIWTPVQ